MSERFVLNSSPPPFFAYFFLSKALPTTLDLNSSLIIEINHNKLPCKHDSWDTRKKNSQVYIEKIFIGNMELQSSEHLGLFMAI